MTGCSRHLEAKAGKKWRSVYVRDSARESIEKSSGKCVIVSWRPGLNLELEEKEGNWEVQELLFD